MTDNYHDMTPQDRKLHTHYAPRVHRADSHTASTQISARDRSYIEKVEVSKFAEFENVPDKIEDVATVTKLVDITSLVDERGSTMHLKLKNLIELIQYTLSHPSVKKATFMYNPLRPITDVQDNLNIFALN